MLKLSDKDFTVAIIKMFGEAKKKNQKPFAVNLEDFGRIRCKYVHRTCHLGLNSHIIFTVKIIRIEPSNNNVAYS